MEGELKAKVAKGTAWAFLEQVVTQGLNFALGVVLARLLTPEDYGTVALVTIFISVSMAIVNSGFGQALVQKNDSDDLDFNSVFWVSLSVAGMLYAVLFACAPFIASYYGVAELKPILRVLSLNLVFFAINSVQNAELIKQMRFDLSFRISMVTTGTSAVAGVSFAYAGFGAWALVWSSVLSSASAAVTRAFVISWRPRLAFSWARVAPLFRFGWKVMVSALTYSLSSNIYGIVIGKCYSRHDLAFVNKGRNIPEMIQNNLNNALIGAAFPALAQLQDERERMREASRRLLIVSSFVILPLMAILCVMSEKMVLFLYGEQWLPCVPFACLCCLSAMFMPMRAVNEQAVFAIGRSDVTMKLIILKNVLSLLILVVFLPRGILLWAGMVAFLLPPLCLALDLWISRRLLGYSIRGQFRAILPSLALVGILVPPLQALNVLWTGRTPVSLFSCLACQGILAVIIVVGCSLAFRFRAACELAAIVEPRVLPHFPALYPLFVRLRLEERG